MFLLRYATAEAPPMPSHAAWHCITQQAALCCFISNVAAVFWHLGATRALESLRSTVNRHACIDDKVNNDVWKRAALVDRHENRHHWWTSHGTVIRGTAR